MTARVLIHPRCLEGPARGALESHLQDRGFDIAATAIGPPSAKGHCDLVRLIGRSETELVLERMDGVLFKHPVAGVLPEPEAA
jgi:hypothetical protein